MKKKQFKSSFQGLFFFGRLLIILALLCQACDMPISLSMAEAKRRALLEIGTLKDTSQIAMIQVKQDSLHHWLIAYNLAQTQAHVFLFLAENAKEPSHHIAMPHKQDAKVERVIFQDVTYDGTLEMLVYLHYDYDLSYQGKELLIYQAPFDTAGIKEIFHFDLEQVWEHIESFDAVYGVPDHRIRVENHCTVNFFEGNILIKGTIDGREHRMLEYAWDEFNNQFRLVLDENLHEEQEENKAGFVGKIKGAKILMEVTAHEVGCRAFIIEDLNGHVVELSSDLHNALSCSNITSLSDDGRFIAYMDLSNDQFRLYDFEANEQYALLNNLQAMEGVSDVIWYKDAQHSRLAFVAVNLDEYEANTKIYVWDFNKKNNQWTKRVFSRTVFFDCNFDGICVPQAQYDYRFSKIGNFLYRSSDSGHTLEDFFVIKL